ncbi:BOI-related E3 ubiquitin-protein ligase 1-like [Rutidosis leptorrhynchoides]|uniref:BOI-related E3 ubiquitin-protein ligase 1-like n=1 Tax=Rutidosis leptorrhynchoides TaxID=125765 RepID=UPI003A9943B0
MAVQAQCSSNFLLRNRNINIQEGKAHIGGGGGVTTTILDHQSFNNSFFNNFQVENSSTNQINRGSEEIMNQFIYNFHQQQQSHCNQFMDVSQIQSRNIDVSTGLKLAFNDHHHQEQQKQQQQSSGLTSLLSQDLSNLISQQGDEIHHYLQIQDEYFRRKLAEKRQQHYIALIGAAKESASRIIKEKEVEADKAARRHAELSARASQLSTEAENWQAKARAQDSVAAALQAQLHQAMAIGGACISTGEEVAARDAEDAESSYVDPDRVVVVSGPGCKACGKRVASVVLLPCRHLCVCSECDDVVQSCPLCLSFRTSSIEVYMS